MVLPGASVLRPGPPTAAQAAAAAGSQQPQQQQAGSSVAAAATAAGPPGPPPGSSHAAAMAAVAAQAAADRSSAGSSSGSSRAPGGGLDAKLETLASLCELASTVTGVDHPLCLDCAAQLKEEVEAQITDLESEIAAYSNALRQLEAESGTALSEVRG